MSIIALRKAFTEELLTLAREDKRLWAVCTDSRGSVTLGDFAQEFPEQFVECGIAEQDAVGIAAGLTLAGVRPFVCGPACFLAMRSAEQVKVDVAYAHRNVKIMGVSGGISYGALGSTHHAVQDIALMRAIPGLEVYIPSDAAQMRSLTRYLAVSDEPAYIRVGRGGVPTIYDEETEFIPGKAIHLRHYDDAKASVIACGELVWHAMTASDALAAEGIHVNVYDMPSIKPMDVQAVLEAASTGLVITCEEHSRYGGLGGAVAELLAESCPTRMRILALPDENVYTGTSAEVFAHYGLDAAGLTATFREMITAL